MLVPAHMARAYMNHRLGQWDRVAADCDEVVRLAPDPDIRSRADGLRRQALAALRQSPAAAPGMAAALLSPDLAKCANTAGDNSRGSPPARARSRPMPQTAPC